MIHQINDMLGRMAANSADRTWVLFRILASAMFMTHGFDKLFGSNPQPFTGGGMTSITIGELINLPLPMDINALFIAGVIEFFGGLFLLVGLWTHIVALIIVLLMAMAYLTAHLAWFPTLNNGELAAMYFLTYLAFFTFGPGPYSADTWLAVRKQARRRGRMERNR